VLPWGEIGMGLPEAWSVGTLITAYSITRPGLPRPASGGTTSEAIGRTGPRGTLFRNTLDRTSGGPPDGASPISKRYLVLGESRELKDFLLPS